VQAAFEQVGAGGAEGGDELAGDQAGLVGQVVDDLEPAVQRSGRSTTTVSTGTLRRRPNSRSPWGSRSP
jgi:hypothetical protein